MTRYKRTGSATFLASVHPSFQNKLTQDTVGGALTDEYLSFSCLSGDARRQVGHRAGSSEGPARIGSRSQLGSAHESQAAIDPDVR